MPKECVLCGLPIEDHQSRVIYHPQSAHRDCRDVSRGHVSFIDPKFSLEDLNALRKACGKDVISPTPLAMLSCLSTVRNKPYRVD